MRNLGIAAVLAASTSLTGGAVWSQTTLVTDIVADGTPFAALPSYYAYSVTQVTVVDASIISADTTQNSINGYNDTHFGISYNLFAANADVSALPFSSAAISGALASGTDTTDASVALLTGQGITNGQYQLVVSMNHYDGYSSHEITAILNGMILGWGASQQAELAAMLSASGGAARLIVVDAGGVARDLGQVSLATRDATGGFVRGVDGTVTASTQGAPGLVGGLYTWADVTSFRTTETGGGTNAVGGSGFAIGADIGIGPDTVAGLSLGFSEINASDGSFSQDGQMTYLQPYLSYRAGNWHGNASLMYGVGSFDQTSTGGTGTADMTLTAVTFEGGYDYALAEEFTLTPTIGLLHGQQEIEGTGGTLTTSETYQFSQGSLGARITFDGPDGSLFAGLHADYLTQDAGVVLVEDLLVDDGWTGRVELGGSTGLGNGLGLATSVNLSGLGGDMRTIAGALRVAFTF